MKKLLLLCLAVTGCGGDRVHDPIQPIPTPLTCTVVSVADGDTIRCAEFAERVRLVEIDAPEMEQRQAGALARVQLESLVAGRQLRLEYDVEPKDSFGRWLAYAWLGSQHINLQLVSSGYAVVLIYAPNVKYESVLRAAEAEARAQRRGLWATNGFSCLPVDFRAGRCR